MSASVAEWTRLMNQARVKLTGVSDAALKGELFDVMQEFYDASSSWIEALTINVIPNVVAYDLVPTNGQAIRLLGIAQIDPTSPLTPAAPRGGIMPNFGQVILNAIPGQAATYQAIVALNVSLPVDKNGFPITSDWALSIY